MKLNKNTQLILYILYSLSFVNLIYLVLGDQNKINDLKQSYPTVMDYTFYISILLLLFMVIQIAIKINKSRIINY